MQFAYCESRLAVGMRFEPGENYKDKLFVPCLPNINDNGEVCQPNTDNFDDAIDTFWHSTFKIDDEWLGVESLLNSGLWYNDWEKMTKEDPQAVLALMDSVRFQTCLDEEEPEYFVYRCSKWKWNGVKNGQGNAE
jgi:hypothetical protein